MLEELRDDGSLTLWLASFAEMFFDESVSYEISEFVRREMRERLKHHPSCSICLIPTDYGFGTHRVPLESGFLEVFLQDNVHTVNCATTRSRAWYPKASSWPTAPSMRWT